MSYIEIENKLINTEQICFIEQFNSKYDPSIKRGTVVYLIDGNYIGCGPEYYNKIIDILKPIKLSKND